MKDEGLPSVVILAAGMGTRLRDVVADRPKPMADINGRPFLDYLVGSIVAQGFRDVIICVSYMRDVIIDYFSKNYSGNVRFSIEESPKGTAAAIKNAERIIDSTFIVVNGDTFLKIDYKELLEHHKRSDAIATIVLSKATGERYGSVKLDGNRVIEFTEKSKTPKDFVSAGTLVFDRKVLDMIPKDTECSLERDTIPMLIREGFEVNGYVTDEEFIDIGTPESYNYIRSHPNILNVLD